MELSFIILSLVPVILSTIGAAIGQGLIGTQAIASMQKQPEASNNISKLCVIGIAITETAAVIGIVISLLLLNDSELTDSNSFTWYALAGIASAVGISGLCAGVASSFPAIAACQSLARQPLIQTKILNVMLITQTLIMTPNMFGMIIALLIKNRMVLINDFSTAMQLLSSGLSIGIGCIGSSIGLAIFAYQACIAIGVNKKGYNKIVTFTFICQAIIETPIIFALIIGLLILNTQAIPTSSLQPWQFFAAALCISLSSISPGINLGRTGATACQQIAHHLDEYGNISKITLLALAMIDTFTIYGLLISIIILLF